MPHLEDCSIQANVEVARDHYRLVLHAPFIADQASPGQFCMLEIHHGFYPFLRRPMSFERIFADGVSVLYKIHGEGTRMLSALPASHRINVQGPLGKGFPIDRKAKRHILVAGGIGIAPFPGLAEAIIQKLGATPEVIIAARNAHLIIADKEFRQMGCDVQLATDDGSAGKRAFAAQVLEELEPNAGDIVYCCGPMPMMKATHDVCERAGVRCYASLEALMACGDGVCLGCAVPANVEVESERMVRVCREGPVFDTRIIDWEAYAIGNGTL